MEQGHLPEIGLNSSQPYSQKRSSSGESDRNLNEKVINIR